MGVGIGPEVDRQEGLIEKIGILGGTFDPVHNGHLVKAGEALERLELDRVLFMVAGDPWMKRETGQTVSPAHHRLEMVRLAVAGDPAFVTDDREVRRPGPTYTVDTLDELAAGHHGADLFLLLGSDTLASLRDWHMPRRVLELAQVVVLDRPGTAPGVAALDRIAPGASARTHVLPDAPLDVSSSALRLKVVAGEPIREWVPESVATYIVAHGLYRNDKKGDR